MHSNPLRECRPKIHFLIEFFPAQHILNDIKKTISPGEVIVHQIDQEVGVRDAWDYLSGLRLRLV